MTTGADHAAKVGPAGTTHGERQAMPLSPHLQVWKFTVTMAASITQRATGIANVSGTVLLAAWAFSVARGPESFGPFAKFLTSPLGMIILFGYVWSLCFHMLGGLRYLYTDTGRGLVPATASRVAWFVYIASFVLAGLIALGATAARGA
ncbi:MAG: succinate dehydrogenase, cytochrome b556 subunit [Pseudomonadota bacterium]